MLNDVLVVGLAIGLWLALGYPVARLGPSVVWPHSLRRRSGSRYSALSR